MGKFLNLEGKKIGRWSVLAKSAERDSAGSVKWMCECECGVKSLVSGTSLNTGTSVSCGCYQKEIAKSNTTHGLSSSREYNSWCSMKARCTNPKNPGYKYYGGRGIKVCDRWVNSFDNFLLDMGQRPSIKHTIDRHPDINGDYTPTNCRWGTKPEQSRGTRRNIHCKYNGKTMVLQDWAKKIGVPHNSMLYHVQKGTPFEEIMNHFLSKKKEDQTCN